jgi:hypothetical protein
MISKVSVLQTYESVKMNWTMWLAYTIALLLVARDDIVLGVGTFFALVGGAYFVHRFSHLEKNFFTILHHYHHENNNWFAYVSQLMMELLFGVVVAPTSYAGYGMNPYVVLLFVLVYSSVHNVNYGLLKVNAVHSRHHENIHQNIGPDVCDILFQTKHGEPEDTSHYVPNIIAATTVVLLIKHHHVLESVNWKWVSGVGGVLYALASWYAWTKNASRKTGTGQRVGFEKQRRGRRKPRWQRGSTVRKSRRAPERP